MECYGETFYFESHPVKVPYLPKKLVMSSLQIPVCSSQPIGDRLSLLSARLAFTFRATVCDVTI